MPEQSNTPATTDYYLKPGFVYLPVKPTTISTVVGSSVAVSLYDRTLKIGGMNHFLYPFTRKQSNATAHYGNIAIKALLRMMKANGASRSNVEAQIFGGAHNAKYAEKDVGRKNSEIAFQILEELQIKIASQDVGGKLGRKIVFNTSTCEIVTLKVERLRDSDWYPYPASR